MGRKNQSISSDDSQEIAKGILAIGPDITRRKFLHSAELMSMQLMP